jgi:hypothetical protein
VCSGSVRLSVRGGEGEREWNPGGQLQDCSPIGATSGCGAKGGRALGEARARAEHTDNVDELGCTCRGRICRVCTDGAPSPLSFTPPPSPPLLPLLGNSHSGRATSLAPPSFRPTLTHSLSLALTVFNRGFVPLRTAPRRRPLLLTWLFLPLFLPDDFPPNFSTRRATPRFPYGRRSSNFPRLASRRRVSYPKPLHASTRPIDETHHRVAIIIAIDREARQFICSVYFCRAYFLSRSLSLSLSDAGASRAKGANLVAVERKRKGSRTVLVIAHALVARFYFFFRLAQRSV